MIRRFLTDTRELILAALHRLGLAGGGAAWRRERLRRRVDGLLGEATNVRRSVGSTHRMCRECRALVPRRERSCPECGASMAGVPRGGSSRVFSFLAPSFGSASLSLLAAMVVVYVAVAAAGPEGPSLWAPDRRLLDQLGCKWAPAILAGEWWRLINPIFLHASILHLFFNGYALAALGPVLEASIGARRFLALFMGAGIVSFVASTLLLPGAPSLGASGALYGLIGFGIVHGWRRKTTLFRALAADLRRWAIFGLLLSLMPGIDLAAHAGGLVFGAALGLFVGLRAVRSAFVDRLWTAAAAASILAPIVGLALALTRR